MDRILKYHILWGVTEIWLYFFSFFFLCPLFEIMIGHVLYSKRKKVDSALTNTEPPVVWPRSANVTGEQGYVYGVELFIDKNQVISYNNSLFPTKSIHFHVKYESLQYQYRSNQIINVVIDVLLIK